MFPFGFKPRNYVKSAQNYFHNHVPLEKAKTALGVVALFLFLITGSAFTGHSGAERESTLASKVDPQKSVSDGVKAIVSSTTEQSLKLQIQRSFPRIVIQDVVKVKNTFLKGMYLLKKEEYKAKGRSVMERQLFHVTSAANVDSIIKDNFDWRRVKRGRFGIGTSFSDDAQYADKYANTDGSYNRAIIVCNVLTSLIYPIRGPCYNLKVPPEPYDTTSGNKGKVYVKFEDNEFLPRFVVYYKTPSSDFSLDFAATPEARRVLELLRSMKL